MIIEKLKDLIANPFSKKYKTGLVLSGGAARGFAHLGVIKALNEHNIKPDIAIGVSAGSIAGGFFADGFEPDEVLEIFQKHKVLSIVEFSLKRKSLLKLSGLQKILKNNLRSKNIEDLQIPFIIGASDLLTGESVYFRQGNLAEAIVTSSSIPVVFPPVNMDGRILVDGGVTNNLPTEPLEGKCKTLIGSHVNPLGKFNNKKGLVHIALQSFHVGMAGGIDEKKKVLDYFIEPKGLEDYTYYELDKADEMVDIGYKAAKEVLSAKAVKELA